MKFSLNNIGTNEYRSHLNQITPYSKRNPKSGMSSPFTRMQKVPPSVVIKKRPENRRIDTKRKSDLDMFDDTAMNKVII